ncbi:hypothetical protein HFP15_06985 [Amycolatopsis sp. K13G38]|uniref:Uncharacterized protein n=1 Tax=Amycolatopsis acididurans TaxID=2724524 RepID=A0ABX1IYN2_9PSEU|nr:hypothetical protein [Amycolatopsis acididurans]NKQ52623.1 hypothetical protein [Amycolatopsis acididurans]
MRTLVIPLAACAFALAACGTDLTTASTPAVAQDQTEAAREVPCGTVPAAAGARANVVVRRGNVDCAQATAVVTRYFARLSPSDAARPDGAGPVALEEWTCGSDPGVALNATCSTEDDREIDTTSA